MTKTTRNYKTQLNSNNKFMSQIKQKIKLSCYKCRIMIQNIMKRYGDRCFVCNKEFESRRDIAFAFLNNNRADIRYENVILIHRDCHKKYFLSQSQQYRRPLP